MKTWQTKAEIHSEAWFGGQVERVVALLAEINEANDRCALVATERDQLREKMKDADDSYRSVVNGTCFAGDELHCSCVPVLRKEIERTSTERDAESELVATLQTELNEARTSYVKAATERDEAREDAASWERVATEQQDRAMRAEKRAELAASKAEPSSASTPDPSLVYWEGRYVGELADLMAVAERVRNAMDDSARISTWDGWHVTRPTIEWDPVDLAALVKGGGR